MDLGAYGPTAEILTRHSGALAQQPGESERKQSEELKALRDALSGSARVHSRFEWSLMGLTAAIGGGTGLFLAFQVAQRGSQMLEQLPWPTLALVIGLVGLTFLLTWSLRRSAVRRRELRQLDEILQERIRAAEELEELAQREPARG